MTVFATAAHTAEAAKSTARRPRTSCVRTDLRPRSPPPPPSRHLTTATGLHLGLQIGQHELPPEKKQDSVNHRSIKNQKEIRIAVVVASNTTYLRECGLQVTLVDLSVMTIE